MDKGTCLYFGKCVKRIQCLSLESQWIEKEN